MDTKKQAALAAVENKKELLQQVADSIWAYAELSLQEYRSAALYEQVLGRRGVHRRKGHLRYRNGLFLFFRFRAAGDRHSGGI